MVGPLANIILFKENGPTTGGKVLALCTEEHYLSLTIIQDKIKKVYFPYMDILRCGGVYIPYAYISY